MTVCGTGSLLSADEGHRFRQTWRKQESGFHGFPSEALRSASCVLRLHRRVASVGMIPTGSAAVRAGPRRREQEEHRTLAIEFGREIVRDPPLDPIHRKGFDGDGSDRFEHCDDLGGPGNVRARPLRNEGGFDAPARTSEKPEDAFQHVGIADRSEKSDSLPVPPKGEALFQLGGVFVGLAAPAR